MTPKSKTKRQGQPKNKPMQVRPKAPAPQKPKMTEQMQQQLRAELSQQFSSFHMTLEEALASDKSTRYVMAKDGVMQVQTNEIGLFILKPDHVAGAEKIEESFRLNLPKKIPYQMFLQTLSFFRGVCEKVNGAEAALQIFWDRTKEEYFVHVPEQTVGSASVNFDRDRDLEAEHLLVMDIHSHNTMGAFWSATDDGDEKETRLFGVLGRITQSEPEYKFRACSGGTTMDLDLFDVFENPFADVDVPKEWYDKVEKEVFPIRTYAGGQVGAWNQWKKAPAYNGSPYGSYSYDYQQMSFQDDEWKPYSQKDQEDELIESVLAELDDEGKARLADRLLANL